jgi:hypothetical protein
LQTERPLVSTSSAEDARHHSTGLQAPQLRSERVKLRRGLTFLGMTLLLPGSAQVAAGNRRLGRVALRVWAALWVVVVLLAVLACCSSTPGGSPGRPSSPAGTGWASPS